MLNGVRRSVKAGVLPPEEATVHFFRDRDAGGPQVISPTIDGAGNLNVWPEGFFDQFDKEHEPLRRMGRLRWIFS